MNNNDTTSSSFDLNSFDFFHKIKISAGYNDDKYEIIYNNIRYFLKYRKDIAILIKNKQKISEDNYNDLLDVYKLINENIKLALNI